MHYYKFHIGDYASHTQHLDPLEDIAYRRMLDWLYLNEIPLPKDHSEIARLIRMRTHCDCIANVLREFFELGKDGYRQPRIERELESYSEKSEKARKSAKARWDSKPSKQGGSGDANALRNGCERNANHKPLTTNHKPLTNGRFTPPSVSEVQTYIDTRDVKISAQAFVDHYQANGWMRGKNKIKDWKACVRTWEQKEAQRIEPPKQQSTKQRTLEQDLTDTSWAN